MPHHYTQTTRANSWHFERIFTPHHVSHVMCHMSYVRCHVSHVRCHIYIYIYICFYKVMEGLLSTGTTLSSLKKSLAVLFWYQTLISIENSLVARKWGWIMNIKNSAGGRFATNSSVTNPKGKACFPCADQSKYIFVTRATSAQSRQKKWVFMFPTFSPVLIFTLLNISCTPHSIYISHHNN